MRGLWYRWNAGVNSSVHLAPYPRPPMPEYDMPRPLSTALRVAARWAAPTLDRKPGHVVRHIGGRGGRAVSLRSRFRDLPQDGSFFGEFSAPHASWEISAEQPPRDVP